MSDLEHLVEAYLDGRASTDEIGRLDALVRDEPEAAAALLAAAALESHLRQVMAGKAPAPGVDQDILPPAAEPGRTRRGRWMRAVSYAAALTSLAAGWAAAYWHSELRRESQAALVAVRQDVGRLELALAEKERQIAAAHRHPGGNLRVLDTLGSVLILPEGREGKAIPVSAGSAVPLGRSLWTCPWGAMDMRYDDDGTTVALDRSTVAALSESDGVRHVHLKSGILVAKRWPPSGDRAAMLLHTEQAQVALTDAQVALAIVGNRTYVEVAMGGVTVTRQSDGHQLEVPVGHYAIAGPGADFRAIRGRLQWRLAPSRQ